MKLIIDAFADGAQIPAKFAFGQIPPEGRFALSDNVNPALAWENVPVGTKSLALLCHDPDVPSSGEDVNQEGRSVPPGLARVDFYHWVVANIPATTTAIPEGAESAGVTAKGKPVGARAYGLVGQNDYTGWFAGDPEMGGTYGGYDGPCPPWNDGIIHHYHFTLFALDVETLPLSGAFTGADLRAAMEGHILEKAVHIGTYSMNRDLAV